jgi:hypothetical protein
VIAILPLFTKEGPPERFLMNDPPLDRISEIVEPD